MKSAGRVILWTNVYMVPHYLLIRAVRNDYLMLKAKPATPSLGDLLPARTYNVFYMERIGLATALLQYSPFFALDLRSRPTVGGL